MDAAKEKVDRAKKETIFINDKKHRTQMAVTSLKGKMMKEITDFSHELSIARNSVYAVQESMLNTIRTKVEQSTLTPHHTNHTKAGFSSNNPSSIRPKVGSPNYNGNDTISSSLSPKKDHQFMNSITTNDNNLNMDNLMEEVGVSSPEELITLLQRTEEVMFVQYTELQDRNLEVERMDLENKKLQEQALREVCLL